MTASKGDMLILIRIWTGCFFRNKFAAGPPITILAYGQPPDCGEADCATGEEKGQG